LKRRGTTLPRIRVDAGVEQALLQSVGKFKIAHVG
jgi:hypothetical protein